MDEYEEEPMSGMEKAAWWSAGLAFSITVWGIAFGVAYAVFS